MKGIHLWLAAIAGFTIISLAGCRKDKDAVLNSNPKNKTRIYLPAKISGANSTTTYSYYNTYPDSTGLIRNVTKTDGADTYKYELLNPRKPTKLYYYLNGELITETVYALDANRNVIRGDIYTVFNDYESVTLVGYYILSYNSSNKLSQVNYFKANGDKDFDEFFEYSPEGNISRIMRSANTTLTYDNLNGMGKSVENAHLFYIQGRDYMLFYNQNNLTKVSESTRSYQFNDDKYPIEMTVKNQDSIAKFKIEYVVK